MTLEHVAIWTNQLEKMKEFYTLYFNGKANEKYDTVEEKGIRFESYFITFGTGSRLELMQISGLLSQNKKPGEEYKGITHIAFCAETKKDVDELTEKLRSDGYIIVGEPRYTGDGYYESCVLDPDGNKVEITVVP